MVLPDTLIDLINARSHSSFDILFSNYVKNFCHFQVLLSMVGIDKNNLTDSHLAHMKVSL